MTFLDAGADIIQGLADSVPAALGLFFSTVTLLITGILKIVDIFKKRNEKAYTSIKPVAPAEPAPPPLPSSGAFSDPSLTGKLLEANVSLARVGWDMDNLREKMDQVRAERDEVAADARRTASTLVATQSQLVSKQKELNSARAKLYTLEQATAQWKAIAEERQREIDELTARLERVPTGRPPPR